MAVFYYNAIDEDGNKETGEMEAESADAVRNSLLSKGFLPLKVKKKLGILKALLPDFQEVTTQIKLRDLILFTKQFRTMKKAGVPLMDIFHTLEDQTQNINMKKIINSISKDVLDRGLSLYGAFQKYPRAFSSLYCSVIQAGEASGRLHDVLQHIIDILEHEQKITSEIKAVLRYPAIVLIFLVIAFFVLLIVVLPKFLHIFKMRGINIPLPTQICVFMYTFICSYWYILLGISILSFIIFLIYLKTENGKYIRDLILLKLPLFGDLIIKNSMARFASIFSILQYAGVSAPESMTILSGTIGNRVIAMEFENMKKKIEVGGNIADQLRSSAYFPAMVTNMVAIGEKTENLDTILKDVSEHYISEMEYSIKEIMDFLNPFLTISMAVVVGFFALAIFLPMWDMTKIVR